MWGVDIDPMIMIVVTKRQKYKKAKRQKGKKTKIQKDKRTKGQKDKRGPEGPPCTPHELEQGGQQHPKF